MNDKTDWTYRDIVKNRKQILDIKIERMAKIPDFCIKPSALKSILAYVNAMMQSIRYIKRMAKPLAISTSLPAAKSLSDAHGRSCLNQLFKTDGLILDLRDGYGASDLSDLDFFSAQTLTQ
ncbi:MAG: hypothetical protein IPL73_27905 [Candidatus Obscuribacter sp.]|nr:hypothetical protein [Candidatus Obscuribacter sp.]